jgi:hypothetical protein
MGKYLEVLLRATVTPKTIQVLSACTAAFYISPSAILSLREEETNQLYFHGSELARGDISVWCGWPEHRDVDFEGQDGAICHHLYHYPIWLASDLTPTQAQSIIIDMCI